MERALKKYVEGRLALSGYFFTKQAWVTKFYADMIIGENSREGDMDVNPYKSKKLNNMRAPGSDDTPKIEPPRIIAP